MAAYLLPYSVLLMRSQAPGVLEGPPDWSGRRRRPDHERRQQLLMNYAIAC